MSFFDYFYLCREEKGNKGSISNFKNERVFNLPLYYLWIIIRYLLKPYRVYIINKTNGVKWYSCPIMIDLISPFQDFNYCLISLVTSIVEST